MDEILKIFETIKNDLGKGVDDRKHGYHTPIFSNYDKKEKVKSRIVVLRFFNQKLMKLDFHTDIRSKKIKEIESSPFTSFLFYDHKTKIQLRVKTLSEIHYKNQLTKNIWSKTPLFSRKCYLATKSPSSFSQLPTDSLPDHLKGKEPTKIESEEGFKNFSIISSQIKTIDWLHLSSSGHKRLFIEICEKKNSFHWLIP